jgi:hypothetical protein
MLTIGETISPFRKSNKRELSPSAYNRHIALGVLSRLLSIATESNAMIHQFGDKVFDECQR